MRRRFMTNSDPIPYMYIEALNDNTQISFSNNSYQYKVGDDAEWLKIKDHPIPTVSSGEKVYFKGALLSLVEGVGQFTVDKEYKVGGDLRTLIYGDNVKKSSPLLSWCFHSLFVGSPIKEIDKDSLPATTLAQGCYCRMFYDCTSLITAPELPATTLTTGCYDSMFKGCRNLTTAPALPATTLAVDCYYSMFKGCRNLTTAPELPATTLANSCYSNMFYNCTSLTTAPELPATTLVNYCYYNMFYNCTKLNYIKMLATDISASNCSLSWVGNVSSTGTFVKNPDMTTLPTGSSGIPSGWTVVDDEEESGGNLITFTINGTEYQAEEGMTWGKWVDSEYDREKFGIDFDNSIGYNGFDSMFTEWVGTNEGYVFASDIIQEGYTYLIVG